MKVRKKPVEVDAYKMENEFFQLDTPAWVNDRCKDGTIYAYKQDFGKGFRIKTLEGEMFAPFGHYLIRGIEGEIYACNPDIFNETYELLEEAP